MKIRKQDISEIDLFITIALLVFTAVFVSGFFSLLTDAIRYVSLKPMDSALIFSGENRLYFNLFFAGIGLLLGQYYGVQYLLSKISIKSYYKYQILNENQWLSWVVIFLIVKGMSILVCYRMIFEQDSLQDIVPIAICIMLVMLIVLCMYSWQGLRRYVFGTQLIGLMFSLIVFFVLSFSIAQIDFIDRELLDQTALSKNIVYTHQINYPKSIYSNKIQRKSLIHDFVIGKNPKTKDVEVFYNNTLVPLEHLDKVIYNIRGSHRDAEFTWLTAGLRIDKDILIKELLPVFNRFYITQFNRFAVYVEGEEDKVFTYRFNPGLLHDYVENDLKVNKDSVPNMKIPPAPPPPITVVNFYRKNKSIDVYATPKGIFLKNDEPFSVSQFTNELREEIRTKEKHAITTYFVDVNVPFGTYIETKSKIFNTYHTLREAYAIATYHKSFEDLDRDKYIAMRKKYPLNIVEFGLNNLTEERLDAFCKE